MPTIEYIKLKNFKGVSEITIDFTKSVDCPVITLIGLNESGKTTILEGLSHFASRDETSEIFSGVHTKPEIAALIPLHRKAAFTGSIVVEGKVTITEDDINLAQMKANKLRIELSLADFPKSVNVEQVYLFEDSVLKERKLTWDFPSLKVVSPKGHKVREYVRPKSEDNTDLWKSVTDEIWTKIPRIAYFPTFLVDMPSRIYLKAHKDERPVNRYYREVFQDILESLGEGLSLEKHVSKRIDDFRSVSNAGNWYSVFFGGAANKSPIDSVFQKISNAVTKEVLGSWKRVFQRPIAAKSIAVEWNVDTEKGDLPYASFVVSDGESRYAISERSLGFRWFFSFLLFTAFKRASKRATVFVFDEPAANLHAKAQAELLTSFDKLVAAGNRIVYSTHSHHMINPRWLSGAYIVENTALDYDSEDAFDLSTKPTNIVATKYRSFVSQYPSRSSYFQPVVEKLEYVTPEILGSPPFVIVEGITDYYALRLASLFLGKKPAFSFMPGSGAGASGPLISLLLGRGDRFLLLLDDDKAGRAEKVRYIENWHLSESIVLTLQDLDTGLKGKKLEKLLSEETISSIKAAYSIFRQPTKKEIGLYLAEKCAMGAGGANPLSAGTSATLSSVMDSLSKKLEQPNER